MQMLSAPFHFCRPVAFSVKTNVMYDGTLDEETPVHGSAVSFRIGDYLHIFEKFDANWWVGLFLLAVAAGFIIWALVRPLRADEVAAIDAKE